MLTRILRRYSGSPQRGETRTASMSRAAAERRNQVGFYIQRSGGAEDGTVIGVVHNVLQDRDPARFRKQFMERHRCGPLHGGHGSAVQVESGYLFEQGRAADEGRYVRVCAQDILQVCEPLFGQEKRSGPVAGGQGPAQDP
jgi:hypothetical protein